MNLRRIVLLVLWVLAFEASGSTPELPVKGRVLAKGQGLAAATIRLLPAWDRESWHFCAGEQVPAEVARTTSDQQGYFELKAKAAGFYRLVLEAEGYVGVVEELALLSPSRGSLPPFELAVARRVQFEVLGPEGEKIEGARIRHFFAAAREQTMSRLAPWPELHRTDKDGRVNLLMPTGSDGIALIAAPGFPVAEVELPAGSSGRELRLTPGREVLLETVDMRRRPLPAVAVAVLTTGGRVLMPITCSAPDGRARVHVLPGQDALYLFDAAGRATIERLGEPGPGRAGEPTPQPIFLPDPIVVSSRVVDAKSGESVPDAWVYVPGKRPVLTHSDRRGQFEFSLPPFYTGPIHAFKAGYGETKVEDQHVAARAIPLRRALFFEGLVVEPGGQGLEGATVRISTADGNGHRSTTTSGKGGRFVLEEVAEYPSYELVAHLAGRSSKVYLLDLAAHEGEPLRLEILPAGELALRVLDEQGHPIAGAEVFPAFAADPNFLDLDTKGLWRDMPGLGPSDAEGRIRSGSLKVGDYRVGVLAPGYAPRVQSVRVEPAAAEAEPQEEILVLQAAAATRGVVVDEAGRPLEGAAVFLLWPSHDGSFYRLGPPLVASDARGEFLIREWAAGQKAVLRAEKAGYVPTVLPEIEVGLDQRWVLELKKAGSLRGRVVTAEKGIVEAFVSLSPKNAPLFPVSLPPFARTGKDGSFVLEGIAPGPHDVMVRGVPGYQVYESGPIEIVAGRQLELDIELKKAAVVFGRVTRPGGEPAQNARVQIRSSLGSFFSPNSSVHVDALGQYRIENAAPGNVTVEVYSSGPEEPFTRQVEIEEGLNELDLVLDRSTLSFSGRVSGPREEPIVGAIVNLEPSFGRAVSRADGSVVFEDIEPGDYQVTITKEGYLFPPESLKLEAGQSGRSIAWRLKEATLVVEGEIQGLLPTELDPVEVYAHSVEDGSVRKGIVNNQGRYRIDNLALGTWSLRAQVGRRLVERQIELKGGDVARAESLDFSGLGGYLARVVSDGRPLWDVYYHFVALHNNQERPIEGGSAFDGRLEFWVPPGTYRLTVGHDGGYKTLTFEIVLGQPTEQVIDLAAP